MNVSKQIYVVSDGHDYDPSEVNHFLAKHLGIRTIHVKIPRAMVMSIAHVRLFISQISKKPLHVSPFKIREITSRNWRVDNSKMVRELNFQPKYSLESGLKEALTEDKFI
jgi:nucleoside-diphosphate-sugar epimerase